MRQANILKQEEMKKIKLYIAASIDGYIARTDGEMDWLSEFPITDADNYGYKEFYQSVDTVIMGGRTYRDILLMDFVWPYKDKKVFVVSRTDLMKRDDVEFISGNIIQEVSRLRDEQGEDIWLVGGGELIAVLSEQGLIDEMIITYLPVTLGNGIRLFQDTKTEYKWKLESVESYNNNVCQVRYTRLI